MTTPDPLTREQQEARAAGYRPFTFTVYLREVDSAAAVQLVAEQHASFQNDLPVPLPGNVHLAGKPDHAE